MALAVRPVRAATHIFSTLKPHHGLPAFNLTRAIAVPSAASPSMPSPSSLRTYATAPPRNRREAAQAEEDKEAEAAVRTRIMPVSPSYFTGMPTYTDDILTLTELSRKYSMLPTVPQLLAPRVKWKTLLEYSAASGVKVSKYMKLLTLLNKLNRIDPEYVPAEVTETLERFKSPDQGLALALKPKKLDKYGIARASGRRKTAVARVKLVEGTGEVLVNGKTLDLAFSRKHDRESVIWPLKVTGRMDKYNVWVECKGGGTTGQAEAITLGVAKALMVHEPLLKPVLRRAGTVTRDPRMVERKKPGKLKARKMPAWVKR